MTRVFICFLVVLYVYFFFFFFKQKTEYEMRISDWSSDVCSSDLDEKKERTPGNSHIKASRHRRNPANPVCHPLIDHHTDQRSRFPSTRSGPVSSLQSSSKDLFFKF